MEIDEVIIKESPGLCRCCLSEGCYKDLASEYPWMGENEVYADMLLECFDIGISQHADGPNGPNRLICEVCITRLRDACNFKKQVVEAEKRFVDMLGRGDFRMKNTHVVEISGMKLEPTLEEDPPEEEVEYLEDIDFGDDEPLQKLASTSKQYTGQSTSNDAAVPAKKTRGRPRKSTATVKVSKSKTSDIKPKATRTKGLRTKEDKDKKLELARKLCIKRRNVEYILQYTNATPFLWFKGKYRCFYCTDVMKDPDDLREHTAKKHQFANIELVVHDRTVNNRNRDAAVKIDTKDLTCRLCLHNLDKLEYAIPHLIIAHDAEYNTEVSNCVLPFVLDKTSPSCPICNVKFAFFEYLLRHSNKNHLAHNYMCDICGASFQGENHMRMHNRYYHREGGYPCDLCDVTLTTLSQKFLHQKNVHLVNLSTCPQCPETFKSPYFKRIHLANVHGVEELKIKCPYCPKVYPQESIMSRHMRRVHLREKNSECEICGDKFFGTYDLKLHMVKHNGEKRYICNVCGKKFAKKSNLNSHNETHHREEKFYTCNVCGDKSSTQGKLKNHIKIKHPEFEIVEQECVLDGEQIIDANYQMDGELEQIVEDGPVVVDAAQIIDVDIPIELLKNDSQAYYIKDGKLELR